MEKQRRELELTKSPKEKLVAYALFDANENELTTGSVLSWRRGFVWCVEIGGETITDADFADNDKVYDLPCGSVAFDKNHKEAAKKIVDALAAKLNGVAGYTDVKKAQLAAAKKGFASIEKSS